MKRHVTETPTKDSEGETKNKQQAIIFAQEADDFLTTGNYISALERAEKAIRSDPNFASPYSIRAACRINEVTFERDEDLINVEHWLVIEKLEQALADYKRAAQLEPNRFLLHFNEIHDDLQAMIHYLRAHKLYYDNQHYDAAMIETKEASRLNNEWSDPHILRGHCFFIKNEFEKAINCYEQANAINYYLCSTDDRKNTENIDVFIKNAQARICLQDSFVFYNNQDYEATLNKTMEAIGLNPNLGDAYVLYANCYIENNEPETALNFYKQALKHPLNQFSQQDVEQSIKDIHHYLSLECLKCTVELYNNGEHQTALDKANEAIHLDPNFGTAYALRAECYDAIDEKYKEFIDYKHAAKLDPEKYLRYAYRREDEVTAQIKEGCELFDKGDYEAAIVKANTAIDLKKSRPIAAYKLRAYCYDKLGQWQKALSDYEKVIELNPDDHAALQAQVPVHFLLGRELFTQGQYQMAKDKANAAIRLNNSYAKAYSLRADCNRRMGNWQAALEDYHKAVEIDPYDRLACQAQAEIYLEHQPNFTDQDLINKANEILHTYPECAGACALRGYGYERLQNFQAASTDYKKAIELDPSKYSWALLHIHFMQAKAEFANKQYERAFDHASLTIDIDPNFADGYIIIGNCYNQWKEWQNALINLRQAAKLAPSRSEEINKTCKELEANIQKEADYQKQMEEYNRQIAIYNAQVSEYNAQVEAQKKQQQKWMARQQALQSAQMGFAMASNAHHQMLAQASAPNPFIQTITAMNASIQKNLNFLHQTNHQNTASLNQQTKARQIYQADYLAAEKAKMEMRKQHTLAPPKYADKKTDVPCTRTKTNNFNKQKGGSPSYSRNRFFQHTKPIHMGKEVPEVKKSQSLLESVAEHVAKSGVEMLTSSVTHEILGTVGSECLGALVGEIMFSRPAY